MCKIKYYVKPKSLTSEPITQIQALIFCAQWGKWE